uniref:Uncharacterized protein n=1 Tax=Surirella sp. TaxID=1526603 RepID=A0A2R4A3K6_9STRA|nr:hypothetical protein [Surirella sp.]
MFFVCRCFLFILVLKYFLREMAHDLDKKLEALAAYDHDMAQYGCKPDKVTRIAEEFNISVRTMSRWLAQRKKFQEEFPGQEFPGQKCLIQKFWLKIKVKHVQFVYDRLLVDVINNIRLLPNEITIIKINFNQLTTALNKEFKTNFYPKSVKSIISHICYSKKTVLDQFGINCSEEIFQKNFKTHLISKCKDRESFLAEQ